MDRFTASLKYCLIFLFISIIIYFLDSRSLLSGVWRVSNIITNPLKVPIFRAGNMLNDTFSVFTFWKSGEARIKYLELRVLELETGDVMCKSLSKENKALRDQLEIKTRTNLKYLPVFISGRQRYLSIDEGSDEGVFLGQALVLKDALVGRVIKVMPKSSLVILPVDPEERLAVSTIGKNGEARGVAVGDFGTRIVIDKVLQKEPLSEGDLVVTSGEDGLPKGLLVGVVTKVISNETDVFKKAEVRPALNAGELEEVFLVIK